MAESHAANSAATLVAGAMAVKPQPQHSLIDATWAQMLAGDFTLHVSDVTSVTASVFLIANFLVQYRRYCMDRKRVKHDQTKTD